MQNVIVEANYSFDPSLNFANTGGSADIANISGNTYRLVMDSIPAYTIYTLTVSNITDRAGNLVSPASIILNDDDSDNMPDDWESENGVNDSSGNPDGDSLTNLEEYLNGTDPSADNGTLADSDQDGMPDIWELTNGLDPNSDDSAGVTAMSYELSAISYELT